MKYPTFSSGIINSIIFTNTNYINRYVNNYYISGGLAGSICSIVINPMELYKIRYQNNIPNNTLNIFRGWPATIARDSISYSIFHSISLLEYSGT